MRGEAGSGLGGKSIDDPKAVAREKMDIDHVYEILKIGIDTLAAGTGSIQERLWETWTVISTQRR